MATIPWEYGPIAPGALSVLIVFNAIQCSLGCPVNPFSIKRECYSHGVVRGQAEQSSGIGDDRVPELGGVVTPHRRYPSERMSDPRRLVPFPAKWDRRKVGRVGFDQKPILRHHANQLVVRPFPESHDSRKRHVPPGIERDFRQRPGPGITVENAGYPAVSRIGDDRSGIVLGVASVHNYGLTELTGQLDLRGKRRQLRFAGRVLVVVVEPAFADCHRAITSESAELRKIFAGVEASGIVGMDAGGKKDEAGILLRAAGGDRGGSQRFADADNADSARRAGAGDYLVAVAGERRVREVGVAVDED